MAHSPIRVSLSTREYARDGGWSYTIAISGVIVVSGDRPTSAGATSALRERLQELQQEIERQLLSL